ncbi:MAG: DUF3086 domain-containing protein [Phormidesmis sp.]
MPSEDSNRSDPTRESIEKPNGSGYEYSSAENSAGRAAGNPDDSSTSQEISSPSPSETFPKRPLGLQRSDRSGRSVSGISSSSTSTFSGSGGSSGDSARRSNAQADIEQLVKQGLQDLERQKQALQRDVEQLERRKERLETEMRSSFAGASQDIAIRVQGFKNYLVGSLEDLVTTAEEMNLTPSAPVAPEPSASVVLPAAGLDDTEMVPFAAQRFAQQRDRINSLLDQYRTRPDYYGPPWQLRRTFEPVHGDRTSNWFFTQGGRGAIKSMGSRLQNVLVASAAISCLHAIYSQRLCVLVLATTPERLGEWRRWLQDCLGIARADFGTNRGVMLFEAADPMVQRAERLLDSGRVPFLIMDEAEEQVSLSLLQFPLWLGFAPDPANPSADYDYY